MSWTGSDFHCIMCGSLLKEETPPKKPLDIYDFWEDEQGYAEYIQTDKYKHSASYYDEFGDSNTYHCKDENCPCSEHSSVVLFHPLGDIGSAAGDSLAFGIESEVGDDIFCFMCGGIVNKNKMCCINKKCFYSFDFALNIIETPKIVFGLGYIK